MELNEIKNTFRHLVEYVTPDTVVEDENDGQNADNGEIGGDPNATGNEPMGGGQMPMGNMPMDGGQMPMGNMPMDGDPNAIGNEPMGGEQQSPDGFQPQGIDQNNGLYGMGADNNSIGGTEQPNEEIPGPEDDVIEIDDLTNAQEDTEKKVDSLTSKFEKVINSIDSIEKRISDIDAHTNQYLGALKDEFEKRNPTPMQRLTMRSTKSAPYSMTPNEYMNNYAPENYSDSSDNNGADDQQYKITKGDIDDFIDYNSIAKEIANNKTGLKDIFGY